MRFRNFSPFAHLTAKRMILCSMEAEPVLDCFSLAWTEARHAAPCLDPATFPHFQRFGDFPMRSELSSRPRSSRFFLASVIKNRIVRKPASRRSFRDQRSFDYSTGFNRLIQAHEKVFKRPQDRLFDFEKSVIDSVFRTVDEYEWWGDDISGACNYLDTYEYIH